MVAARRRLKTDEFDALIRELKPTWLVLRPEEAGRVAYMAPGMISGDGAGEFRLVRAFDQSARIAALGGLRGRTLLDRTGNSSCTDGPGDGRQSSCNFGGRP